ncbi:hypothetical protein [Geomicrobium sp. JCM 19038]|uniref:hypothetical protein n=1 Tax=Geomicrobium sp. JCM 19038 TaxID=1460635 RepID=UPI0026BAF3FB|nr:hypothetical protein [Geomicrobium sp. JCM 19038]
MKKQVSILLGGLLLITACSGEDEAGNTDDQQNITIGATAGPYSDMLSSASSLG